MAKNQAKKESGEREKIGRPTKYKDEYPEMLIEHMATGLSYESFAGEVGVCKDTLYEWEKVHPAFSDSKKIGFERNRCFWEKQGVRGLWDEKEYDDNGKLMSARSMNSTVWVFNMKNRFPKEWRDKQEVESTVSGSLELVGLPGINMEEIC